MKIFVLERLIWQRFTINEENLQKYDKKLYRFAETTVLLKVVRLIKVLCPTK